MGIIFQSIIFHNIFTLPNDADQAWQFTIACICCGDRESDIYDLLSEHQRRCKEGGPAAEYLIRSYQNRALNQPEKDAPKRTLRKALQKSEVLGVVEFDIPEKKFIKKVKGSSHRTVSTERRIEQEIRAVTVTLRPPYRKGVKLDPANVHFVEARETHPPDGEDPIVWTLVTSPSVSTLEEAITVLELYRN
jgi:hypothetical protein